MNWQRVSVRTVLLNWKPDPCRLCPGNGAKRAVINNQPRHYMKTFPETLEAFADTLKGKLPAWHFAPYGGSWNSLAAYPPKGVGLEAWNEIRPYASIMAVCGPLYVIGRRF